MPWMQWRLRGAAAFGALVAAMALSGGARAQDGRVTAPADPAKRCAGIPVPPDVCAAKQKKALARGCITQGEYNALVRYGSFPTCDYDDTPPSFQGWCACGCFDQGVRIMARGDGGEMTWQPAGEVAAHVHSYMLAALSPEAKTTEPAFVEAPIRLATKGAEEQPLYVIGTPYGKGLRLTANHAVLLASGKMVTARELQVGESLVGVRGEAVPILSIDRAMATADVVNFATEEEDHLSHILAAEGVLVGDLLWQSSYADELNAVVLRQ